MLRNATIVLVSLVCFASSVFAEVAPSKIETVVVTGIGLDADKARQNAVRNAVEQVVGTYVKSDILVNNSELIKDEILSHSGGYVESTKIISTSKSDDGLITVKLEAKVVSTKLIRKLGDLNIATKKIDNGGLFGAALSKLDADRSIKEEGASGAELLDSILKKYPSAAYKIDVGDLSVADANDSDKTVKVKIPLKISWDSDFLNEFIRVLKQTSKVSSDFEELFSVKKRFEGAMKGDNFKQTFCFTNKSVLMDLAPEYCSLMIVPRSDFMKNSTPTAIFSHVVRGNHKVNAVLKISFKSDNGDVVKVVRYDLKSDNYKQHNLDKAKSSKGFGTSSLTYTPANTNMPNVINGPYATIILKDGVYAIDVNTELNVDLLRQVKSLDVIIEPRDRL